jgi:hypothetical protein
MTKRADSAREVVEQFGGLNRIPKPVREDLERTVGLAIASSYAETWTQRLEAEIRSGRLKATEVRVVEYHEALAVFREVKSDTQEKRTTRTLRTKFENAFWELKRVAESLGIPTSVSPSDNF